MPILLLSATSYNLLDHTHTHTHTHTTHTHTQHTHPNSESSYLTDTLLDELNAVLLQVTDLFFKHGLLVPQLLIACLATTHEHLHGHSLFAVATFTHQKTVHQKRGRRHGHCLSVVTFQKTGDLKSTLSLLLQHFKNNWLGPVSYTHLTLPTTAEV